MQHIGAQISVSSEGMETKLGLLGGSFDPFPLPSLSSLSPSFVCVCVIKPLACLQGEELPPPAAFVVVLSGHSILLCFLPWKYWLGSLAGLLNSCCPSPWWQTRPSQAHQSVWLDKCFGLGERWEVSVGVVLTHPNSRPNLSRGSVFPEAGSNNLCKEAQTSPCCVYMVAMVTFCFLIHSSNINCLPV